MAHGERRCVRIYLGESDRYDHDAISRVLVDSAERFGIVGVVVRRAATGFRYGRPVPEQVPAPSPPVIIELFDETGRLHEFLDTVRPMLAGTLVLEKPIRIRNLDAERSAP